MFQKLSHRALLFLSMCGVVISPRAYAVNWADYELGEFYPISDAEDPTVTKASEAVVRFKGATGFIISPDGYILTNYHVWDGFGDSGKVYRQKTEEGYKEVLSVTLVAKDQEHDMALYKAEAKDLPFVPLRLNPVKVGEDVFIIGHPDGKPLRVSFGKILAKDITISGRPSVEYSAQTWWGSSGSPVFDKQGNVVALHWGWDSQGLSNGRLTGVPVSKLAKAIPEVGEIAKKSARPAFAKLAQCEEASRYSIVTTVLEEDAVLSKGRSLNHLSLSLESNRGACQKDVVSVTYKLHPTFPNPERGGDSAKEGFPIEIFAWGMFEVEAEVTLQSGAKIIVPGYVSW